MGLRDRTLVSAAVVGSIACSHDADNLAKAQEPIDKWLPERAGTSCLECVDGQCAVASDTCLRDRACKSTFSQCYPPKPTCGTASPKHYDFAACVNNHCRIECGFDVLALSCVGDYTVSDPASGGSAVHFEVQRLPVSDRSLVARVEICSGIAANCDAAGAVELHDEMPVRMTYYVTGSRSLPYFRVTGDGVQPLLFFEKLPIHESYRLPIPIVSRLDYNLSLTAVQTTADPARGTINVIFYDCSGRPLDGVHFDLERGGAAVPEGELGVAYYYDGATPRTTSVRWSTTADLYWGGFANLAPGVYDLRASKDGADIGRATAIIVLADTVSHVNMFPLSKEQLQE